MFILNKKYYKDLNKIAIPLIIQNITGMLIGLVDQMFLGRISTEAYGAIGISVSFMYFLAGIFGVARILYSKLFTVYQDKHYLQLLPIHL